MSDRNWGLIRTGATFEGMVGTLLFFHDPGAALFGRPGKDGGQDMRSSDGIRVFQAKYHRSELAATAIRDAKNEAKQIENYRQPRHGRHAQWQGVAHWRLVTNAPFNPTQKLQWQAGTPRIGGMVMSGYARCSPS